MPAASLITTRQTAKLLGVDQSTVWRWANKGRLSAVVLDNGHMLFDLAEVNALEQRRESLHRRRATLERQLAELKRERVS